MARDNGTDERWLRAAEDGLVQDVEIWANKRSSIHLLTVPADGPYGRLRNWYKQFYNERDKVANIQSRVNGTVVTLDQSSTLKGGEAA
jgi:hypothetical protein